MTETERDPAGPATRSEAAADAHATPSPARPASAAPVPPTTTGTEPGRVWGIVSLALAVIPLLQLVGLAAGVVGLVLSARAGRRNGFALAGIVVSLLLLAAAGMFVVLFAFSGYELFGGSVGDVVTVCSELGPGEHVIDGLAYTCP